VTSTWRKVAPKFEGEEAFEALEKIDRLEVFQQYIRCGAAGARAPPRDTAGAAHIASGASATNLARIFASPPTFQCRLPLSCLCRHGRMRLSSPARRAPRARQPVRSPPDGGGPAPGSWRSASARTRSARRRSASGPSAKTATRSRRSWRSTASRACSPPRCAGRRGAPAWLAPGPCSCLLACAHPAAARACRLGFHREITCKAGCPAAIIGSRCVVGSRGARASRPDLRRAPRGARRSTTRW